MGLTYVDSCVLIDATQVGDSRGDLAREILSDDQANGELVTSPLVDLECMVRPLCSRNERFIATIQSSLDRYRRLVIGSRAFELAAHLRARHGLATADALHVATASLGGCQAIWTTDQQILRTLPDFAFNPYKYR